MEFHIFHDLLGRETERAFLDGAGRQVKTAMPYARIAKAYDLRGNVIEEAYFLADDSPTRPVAKMESQFDALGRKTRDRYLGPGGQPASLSGDGQHITLYEYDDYGNLRALRYLDQRGLPARGFARGLDPKWELCARWVPKYGDAGASAGAGECQQALPPPPR